MPYSTRDMLARKALFLLDPEAAHGMAIKALRYGLVRGIDLPQDPALQVTLWDLEFPNPLGMAAGFDKNAEVVDAVLGLGFGAVEVGTITPVAQPGNQKPRMFRLVDDEAVINRLGFNNQGHETTLRRLAQRKDKPGIVGVNIGANIDSDDRVEDYVKGVSTFANVASYLAVNISSPNTPGLRELQGREALDDLLARVLAERDRQIEAVGRKVPVLVKIAPDVDEFGLDDICAIALGRGIDGIIVSNTTLARPDKLKSRKQMTETGGLSGAPLFEKATIALAKTRERVGQKMPLIGVGGVTDAVTALEKIRAGANLVQFYSGMIYGGASMPAVMLVDMSTELKQRGVTNLEAVRGEAVGDWASRSME